MSKCIAENAEVDMSHIITLCDDLMIEHCSNPDLKMAMQMSRGIKPTKPVNPGSGSGLTP